MAPYTKQRILHGRAEIQNFSLSVEKYFTSLQARHAKFYLLYKHQ